MLQLNGNRGLDDGGGVARCSAAFVAEGHINGTISFAASNPGGTGIPRRPTKKIHAVPAGFEPATSRLTAECSNHLSYRTLVLLCGFEPQTFALRVRRSTN